MADSQPVRVAPGGNYGTRQELEALQAAAPMAVADPILPSQAAGTPSTPRGPNTSGVTPPSGVFGATERPRQPVTAGLPSNSAPTLTDPDMLLRIMYQMTGDPALLRLMSND